MTSGVLPRETQNYVRIITGQAAEDWALAGRQNLQANNVPSVPRREIAQTLLQPVIGTLIQATIAERLLLESLTTLH